MKLDIPFFLLFAISALSIMTWAPNTCAQDAKPSEYQVKAAFIYNFVNFVEWPAEAFANTSNTMSLCVLGEDPFGTYLEAYQGETIGNKKLVIKHYKTIQPIKRCHILFISSSEKKQLSQIVSTLKGLSILIIGDTEGFAQQNVIINFYIKQDRVRFEINDDAARRARLKVSSKLLKLAKIVHEEG